MSVEEVGKTTEGRPFVIATVTSEANHARLEEIRRTNARLADPRGLGDEEAERLVQSGKAIVAMAYSIHSTEVGGTLAALRLLHRLAASDDERVRAMLDATVLLVIPSHNPDGTDIVSEWYRKQLGTPFEGTAPPVLYHPYVGHDNNRDWYMFTQQETLLTLRHLHQRWHPQIFHDVHQMGARGARLFVPPYTDPWEPNVDPALTAAVGALGSHVASRLTSAGRSGVVTGAIFDAWTPARAYPHTHGGVRILSETASARIATPLEVKPQELEGRGSEYDPRSASSNFPAPWPGGTWRLADIVETQLQASLAILEHAAQNREHWLRTALVARRNAVARREPFAFVIPPAQADASAVRRLVEVLRLGEVEVERAQAAFVAGERRYPAGSLVVRLQQPASGFAKTLLERQRYPERREYAGGPPKAPYDVTAHTLPLLLGVEVETRGGALRGRAHGGRRRHLRAGTCRGPRPALRALPLERRPGGARPAARTRRRGALEPRGLRGRRPSLPRRHAARSRLGAPRARAPRRRARDRGALGALAAAQPRAADATRGPVSLVGAVDGRGLDALRLREGDGGRLPVARRTATCAPDGSPSASTRSCFPTSRRRRCAAATRRARCRRSTRAASGRRVRKRCARSSRRAARWWRSTPRAATRSRRWGSR